MFAISEMIQLERAGLRAEISEGWIGELISFIISLLFLVMLEGIMIDPIKLWLGHFFPMPFLFFGGCKSKSAGGSGWLW